MSFLTQIFFTILLTVFSLIHTTSAQSTNTPPCVANLIPCANYLALTSTPPQSCCGPLKIAVTTQADCLCDLYNTPGLLQLFKINITQALDVPKRCRIDGVTPAACSKVGGLAPAPSESVAPTGISGTPGNDKNAAGRMTEIGILGLVFTMSWVGALLW